MCKFIKSKIDVLRIVKLIVFYSIFYVILLGYGALMFFLFLQTLDDKEPKWKKEKSLIGDNPGMSFRPLTSDNYIRYNPSNAHETQKWINHLDEFLSPYLSTNKSENVQHCNRHENPELNKVCDFKLASNFVPCLPQYGYSFDNIDKGPCIFLKLNKIFGWEPEFFNSDAVPSNMPQNLIEQIKKAELHNEQNFIWVDCIPVNSTDPEDVGHLSYYPQPGFDGKYFPYLNIKGYLSPLVAVHFENPKLLENSEMILIPRPVEIQAD